MKKLSFIIVVLLMVLIGCSGEGIRAYNDLRDWRDRVRDGDPAEPPPDPPPDAGDSYWGFGIILLSYDLPLPVLCDEGGAYEDRVMVNLFLDAGLTILHESWDLPYESWRQDLAMTFFEEILPNETYPFDLYVTVHLHEASVTCLPFDGPMDGMWSSSIFHTVIGRNEYFRFSDAYSRVYNTTYLPIDGSYLWDWNNLPPLVDLP